MNQKFVKHLLNHIVIETKAVDMKSTEHNLEMLPLRRKEERNNSLMYDKGKQRVLWKDRKMTLSSCVLS